MQRCKSIVYQTGTNAHEIVVIGQGNLISLSGFYQKNPGLQTGSPSPLPSSPQAPSPLEPGHTGYFWQVLLNRTHPGKGGTFTSLNMLILNNATQIITTCIDLINE